MTKRLLLLVALGLLLLSACGKQTSLPTKTELTDANATEVLPETTEPYVYDPSLDAQNKYAIMRGVNSFQETENFFCGGVMYTKNIYYYDKVTGASGILCSDPSCMHNSSSCGAYGSNSKQSMFLYDGVRYWITDDFGDGVNHILWKGNIDGTNQVKLKTIDFENVILTYQPQQYIMHHDNLYFLGVCPMINEFEAGTRISLMASPLDNSEEFTAMCDKTYQSNPQVDVRFVKNHAYLLVQTWAKGNGNCVDAMVYRINLTDRTQEIVFEKEGLLGFYGFWVTDEGEIYLMQGRDICSVMDNSLNTIGSLTNIDDGTVWIVDGAAVSCYAEDGLRYLEVIDFSGTTLYDGPMFPLGLSDFEECKAYSMALIGGDREKLIFEFSDFEEAEKEYVILLDLTNDLEPTILWHTEGTNID